MVRPGIYRGTLRHRRFSPVPNEFQYSLFMAMLDINRIPDLMRVSWLTSYNRWNWASFDERDHFGDPARPLRERLALDAAAHGLRLPDGPVFLLTHLRYLGYCFNPVSFFYCYDTDERLRLILAEVNNNYSGSHNYWLPAEESASPTFSSLAAKSLYVSPFMEIDLDYAFSFTPPGDRLLAHTRVLKQGKQFFDATLSLEYRPWTAPEIRRALASHPAMTVKVITAIYWQAFRLWRKGVPAVPKNTRAGVNERAVAMSLRAEP